MLVLKTSNISFHKDLGSQNCTFYIVLSFTERFILFLDYFLIFFFSLKDFTCLTSRERGRVSTQAGGIAGRGRNRFPAEQGAQYRTIPGLRDHDPELKGDA